jgi:hypothetical protein
MHPAAATPAGDNTNGSVTSTVEAPPSAAKDPTTANCATNGRNESPPPPSDAHAQTADN